jgi:tRNA U34 5-carboxymethylaminomethyl modifying GTPase MnmE/TrmE
MCQPIDAKPEWKEINKADVLEFLRKNKNSERNLPSWITDNDKKRVENLSDVLKKWMETKAPQQAIANIKDILQRKKIKSQEKRLQLVEEKFQLHNFDLIVWEYITSNNNL